MKKKRLTSMRLSQKSKTMLASLAQHFHQSQTAIIENLIQEKTVSLHDRLAPLLPDTVPMRTYVHRFTDSNFLHIPAIEHGFQTQRIHFDVYLDDRIAPLWPVDYDITSCYAVHIGLVQHTLDLESPTGRITALLSHPSGTVIITGPAT